MSVSLDLVVTPVAGRKVWPYFAPHHYLSEKYTGHRAWVLSLADDGTLVAFGSAMAQPSGHFRNGWREHRTVVLPDFQGLGLGPRVSEVIGEILLADGKRFFSRTMHPRMGAYREASPLWRATSKNRTTQHASTTSRTTGFGTWRDDGRPAFAHEYLGRIARDPH